MKLLRCRCK